MFPLTALHIDMLGKQAADVAEEGTDGDAVGLRSEQERALVLHSVLIG